MQGKQRKMRIAYNLSLKAYINAQKEHNSRTNKDREKLKDTHFQLFTFIINKLGEKVVNQPLSTLNSLRISRGELGAYFGRTPETMKNRLKRLEFAGIIRIKFHGHKAPLELIFNKDISILYDVLNLEFIPKSNFLNITASMFYESMSKNFHNIKDTEINSTYKNIKITQTDLTNSNTRTYKKNTTRTYKNTGTPKASQQLTLDSLSDEKKTFAMQMAKEISSAEKISYEQALARVLKGVKEVTPKKQDQHSAETHKTQQIENQIDTKIVDFKKESKDLVSEILHKKKQKRAKTVADKRMQVRLVYVKIMIEYLFQTIFKHYQNQTTENYHNQLTEYVYENYFSDCNTIKSLNYRWEQYKFRINVAANQIKRYKNWDNSYFTPLHYLKIDNDKFSFRKTEPFWKKHLEWQKLNGYNRKIPPELQQKLNTISRMVENEGLNYDDARQKIKNLTIDNAELLRQFDMRMRASVL